MKQIALLEFEKYKFLDFQLNKMDKNILDIFSVSFFCIWRKKYGLVKRNIHVMLLTIWCHLYNLKM